MSTPCASWTGSEDLHDRPVTGYRPQRERDSPDRSPNRQRERVRTRPTRRAEEARSPEWLKTVSLIPEPPAPMVIGLLQLKGAEVTETRITFRGHVMNTRTRDMLLEVERLAGRQYVITQGSYQPASSFSGTTHTGGGVVDIRGRDLTTEGRQYVVLCLRRVGFAAWLRGPWQDPDWEIHIHAVAAGDPELSESAKAQVSAYRNGRNGLVSNGPDDGPRNYVNVTWESYLKNRPTEDDVTEQQAARIITLLEELTAQGRTQAVRMSDLINRQFPSLRADADRAADVVAGEDTGEQP